MCYIFYAPLTGKDFHDKNNLLDLKSWTFYERRMDKYMEVILENFNEFLHEIEYKET